MLDAEAEISFEEAPEGNEAFERYDYSESAIRPMILEPCAESAPNARGSSMIKPPVPANEAVRLASLKDIDLLDTPPEERFDRFTRLAQRSFDVPIALISIVDENRQWFKSRQGLDATETPREISFCGHTILEPDILVIPDALADERFSDNPLVVDDPRIRFYAGCPIATPDGSRIGTLCLIDRVPRNFDDEDLALLRDLGRMVEDDLTNRALATIDPLTQLTNRRGFESLAAKALVLCRRLERPATLLFIDLDRFKVINDEFGHEQGDRELQNMAEILIDTFRDSDVIGRLGGDEFCVLLAGSNEVKTPTLRLEESLARYNEASNRPYDLECSVGLVEFDSDRHHDLSDMISEADERMYERKRNGKRGRDGDVRR